MARQLIVVGAGVVGVTTAHALMADGHRVTLIDAATDAASGASHANGGFLSAAFCAPWAVPGLPRQILSRWFDPDAPFRWRPDGSLAQLRWMQKLLAQCTAAQFTTHRQRMVGLAVFSRACLEEVAAQTGIEFSCERNGVLHLFRDAPSSHSIQQRLAEMRAVGVDARWCTPEDVRSLEPALSPSAKIGGALYARNDATGDCRRFTQDLLAWCIARGLRFEPRVHVDGLVRARCGRLHGLRVGGQTWDADAVVVAAGVDSPRILRGHLHLPVIPVKGYSVTAPVAQSGGNRCAVIDDFSKLALARLSDRVRLAGMAELVGMDRRIDAARCGQLVRHYEHLYGPLTTEGRVHWAGLRPMTPDGSPIIGATPIEGLYLNTGHGTYGWTLASGSAQLLADELAGRSSPLDRNAFAFDPRVRSHSPPLTLPNGRA